MRQYSNKFYIQCDIHNLTLVLDTNFGDAYICISRNDAQADYVGSLNDLAKASTFMD